MAAGSEIGDGGAVAGAQPGLEGGVTENGAWVLLAFSL